MMTIFLLQSFQLVIAILLLSLSHNASAFTVIPSTCVSGSQRQSIHHVFGLERRAQYRGIALNAAEDSVEAPATPAPVLDGKRILPFKIMKAGLKGHKVAAVYGLINLSYKRGSEGWENVVFVGVTRDLDSTLQSHLDQMGSEKVAHVRALSFSFPEPSAMEEVAGMWRKSVADAGGLVIQPSDYLFADEDNDEDEDDDEDEFDPTMIASTSSTAVQPESGDIVSPFDLESKKATVTAEGSLALTLENVDKVLDEIRPYLISDGGNVSVEGVEADKGEVYLKLQGACGSCASSTVTMSMGIERVLKENIPDFKQVVQVFDEDESGPKELTLEAVQEEFRRLRQAIMAMGGVAEILGVDSELGVVELKFRGSKKVLQGLELALLDIPYVNHVKVTMGDD